MSDVITLERPIKLRNGRTLASGEELRLVAWGHDVVTVQREGGDLLRLSPRVVARAIDVDFGGDDIDEETIRYWVYDSVCPTPTGYTVEPDGHGPDGVPSWLIILGYL